MGDFQVNIAYVGGTFDGLHLGHIRHLKAAARIGRLVVAVNTDEFVERYKGRPPLAPLADRIDIVREIGCVNSVRVNQGDENSWPSIEGSGANFIVAGSDWAKVDYLAQLGVTQAQLDSRGIEIFYTHRPVGGPSSTAQRERT